MTAPRRPQDRRRPAKKVAAKKASSPRVGLDLKALAAEVDAEPKVEPFTFNHPTGDGVYTLPHPEDVDVMIVNELWRDPLGNVSLLLRVLGDEQCEKLAKDGGLKARFIKPIIDGWYDWYGIDVEELGKESA